MTKTTTTRKGSRRALRRRIAPSPFPALVLAASVLALGCDRREAPPRGDSRDFELEVVDLHARNQELHDKSQELDQRLAEIEENLSTLHGELAAFSEEEWAREVTQKLDAELEQARNELADFRAATGRDWESLGRQAESAVESLGDAYEEVLRELSQRRSRGGPVE